MELTDLKRSVTEMSDTELFDLLRGIRASRRTPTPKKGTKVADKKVRADKSESIDIEKMFAGMTPEMREMMIKRLGG